MNCKVPGCNGKGSRYGRLCNAHKSQARRHGNPLQQGVRKDELKSYLKVVRKRLEQRPDNTAMAKTEERWSALVNQCSAADAAYQRGRPMQMNYLQACHEVLKLEEAVPAQTIIETVIAMYLLADANPRRFRSDDAFLFQLVRRIRALTDVNVGTWYDHQTHKVKRVYSDLPPRTVIHLGRMLIETFGLVGLFMANLEHEDRERFNRKKADYHEALMGLR